MIDILNQFAATVAESGLATALRYSRWRYASVNAAHILGIALLVGSIIPLDLKLLGVWRSIRREALVRVLVPTAFAGLVLAMTSGALLFSVRATEYVAVTVFQLKLALIAIGASSALFTHVIYGLWLERASRRQLATGAAISISCWLGALVAGRMIAFAAG